VTAEPGSEWTIPRPSIDQEIENEKMKMKKLDLNVSTT
jgi:hypothetical protein